MKFRDKRNQLQCLIKDTLVSLIDSDYHLFDLPYHSNIGDALIWEGELEFLKTIEYKCKSFSSNLTDVRRNRKISDGEVILFHGGGNIGSLYQEHLDYLVELVNYYPNNRIIVFPQTVYFKDLDNNESLRMLSKHQDLHFCSRDKRGFDVLSKFLKNVYLLPDMAFFIPLKLFERYYVKDIKESLYLKRCDGELLDSENPVKTDFVKDWPTFEHRINDGLFIAKILDNLAKLNFPLSKKIWNWYAMKVYKNDLLKIGITFVKSYDPIYTTRLHVMILSLLCGKEVTVIDNNYGKNYNFVNTWLMDVDELHFLK